MKRPQRRARPDRLRIVVAGSVAAAPAQAGAAWAVLQYVLGLRQLGHDVLLVEPIERADDAAVLDRTPVARFFRDVVRDADVADRAALLDVRSGDTVGMSWPQLRKLGAAADVLLNLSGILRHPALLEPIPRRVFVDLDPGFVQLWHAQGIDMGLDAHTHFATVGTNLGAPDCPIPTLDRTWQATLPPVVLDEWPCRPAPHASAAPVTTIGNWRSYGSIDNDGTPYGQRCHSFRALLPVAARAPRPIRLALTIHPGDATDLAALESNGWRLDDPRQVAGTLAGYRSYIQGSHAELCVAKSGYVISRSGWFSDRSACYLASGRPVVAQDTGFGALLPSGQGLLVYTDVDSAVGALHETERAHAAHCRAAREIAATYLDSRRVLGRLLDAVGEG
ncbi:MAG: hypothetical protein KY469_19205 [Actinobacteria bacterium]|nr:hypothetical protein [Actinomycetota bacterium]